MKIDSIKLEKKVRCIICREAIMPRQIVKVERNEKGKIKSYFCKDHENETKEDHYECT